MALIKNLKSIVRKNLVDLISNIEKILISGLTIYYKMSIFIYYELFN